MNKIYYSLILSMASLSALHSNYAEGSSSAYKTDFRYNESRQLVGVIKPDPDGSGSLKYPATRNTYNAQGMLSSVEQGELSSWQSESISPSSWSGFSTFYMTEYTYDSWGRKLTEKRKSGSGSVLHVKQYKYDNLGRVQCEMIRMSSSTASDACVASSYGDGVYDRITKYTYDSQDNILNVKKAYDTPLEQDYATHTYTNGLLTDISDANGNKTELEYDSHGRLEKRFYPHKTNLGAIDLGDYEEFGYDDNDNLNFERKRSGQTINYTHDSLNRITKKDLTGTNEDVYYGYTLQDLEEYARFAHKNGYGLTNVYNGFGELTKATTNMSNQSRSINYQYDKNGNRKRITHPDGKYFQYEFDELNRLDKLKEQTSELLTIAYHRQGQRDYIRRTSGGNTYTNYDFDGIGRLQSLNQNLYSSSLDVTFGFGYNRANQITEFTQSNTSYQYTGNENLEGSYISNGLNQYTSVDGKTLTYDANGNLTHDGTLNYVYDTENRLKTVSGSKSASFTYDPKGRLHQVTVSGVTKRFLYDGDALIAEYTTGGVMTARYVHGDRVDEPLVQYNTPNIGDSNRKFLHADHQGSIIAITNTNGSAINTFEYDVYGIPAAKNIERFGYTGQLYFKDLGLNYYKARIYHPKLGRFLQTDPVGYEDQMNLYAYVGNDPINMVDPTGKFGLAGAAIGMLVEIAAQVATDQFDLSDIVIAGAVGAVTGGVGGRMASMASRGTVSAKTAVKETALASAGANSIGSMVQDTANGQNISVPKAVISGIAGAASGALGSKVGNQAASKLDKLSSSGGINAHIANTTRNSNVGKVTEGSVSATVTAADTGISVGAKKLTRATCKDGATAC